MYADWSDSSQIVTSNIVLHFNFNGPFDDLAHKLQIRDWPEIRMLFKVRSITLASLSCPGIHADWSDRLTMPQIDGPTNSVNSARTVSGNKNVKPS